MRQLAKKPRPSSLPSDPASPDILGEHDGVTFRRERLAPIIKALVPLLEQDWRENGVDHDTLPLAFDYERYLNYDLVGVLQIVTAREDDILVGYVLAFVHPHIDHLGKGWAIITWYWLFPEYRGGGVGRAMMEVMLTFLRTAEVSVVEASEKVRARHKLFDRMGFTPTDVVYRKLL